MDKLKEDLLMCMRGDDVRALAEVLLRERLRYGGTADTLIENRLLRGRMYTDALYIAEMLRVWQEKDAKACARKLFEGVMTLELNMDPETLDFLKRITGMTGAS